MTRYLNLAEYLYLAEQVTGVEAAALAKASRIDLADSALHAPAAGFGDDDDFYPDLCDKGCGALLSARVEPSAAGWEHARRFGLAGLVHRPQRRRVGSRSSGCR